MIYNVPSEMLYLTQPHTFINNCKDATRTAVAGVCMRKFIKWAMYYVAGLQVILQ